MEIIRDELKDYISLRKAAVKFLSMIDSGYIYIGEYLSYNIIIYNGEIVYTNFNKCSYCFLCKFNKDFIVGSILHHNTNIKYIKCEKCEKKTLCNSCLRETSRCRQIHTRKLLCYKILLQHKFPKDIIKLITKKVK